MNDATGEVVADVADGIGQLRLNRPQAINALTLGMIVTLTEQLEAWRDDDSVTSVRLTGTGDRGLCSGADVRRLRAEAMADSRGVQEFFRREYALNAVIAGYGKTYEALMSGITMGGGLGVSAHGSRRLVTSTSRLAMPETIIGFFPDVGMCWWLSRAPGEYGTYLALTGTTIGGAEAIYAGLADGWAGEPGAVPQVPGAWLDRCFGHHSAVEIEEALVASPVPAAADVLTDLRARSPYAVSVTLEAIRRARLMSSVDEVLAQDSRLAAFWMESDLGRHEFFEGVRAQVVDKDRSPRWAHASLSAVPTRDVQAAFD